MSDRQIKSFDGTALNVRVEGPGDAPVVLLSHSLGGSLELWREVAPMLAERFKVVRYDARGHGASGAPDGEYSVEMMARDALAILDSVGAAKAHFVGLSMGGMIGMWLAAHDGARIDRLVLANTTAHIPATEMLNGWIVKAKAEGVDGLAPPIITGWLSAGFKDTNPERTAELVEAMRAMTVPGFTGAVAVLRDSDRRPDLPLIKAPTLVIAGIEDGPRGEGAAQALADGIAGATRANLPAAAHLSPVENPAGFAAAVLKHLG
ncbi:MAG: alpha/beta fold hydrolase [Caulobacteraceae bacterium]